MTHIDIDIVRHLAKLSKISCTEQEERQLLVDLEQIVQYVDQLNEVDTEGVEPLYYVIEGENATPLREDVVEKTITTKEFLGVVPQQVAQMIRVPRVQHDGGTSP